MHVNNRLREDDSEYVIWSLLEVSHLIFDVGKLDEKQGVSDICVVSCILYLIYEKIHKITLGNSNPFCR